MGDGYSPRTKKRVRNTGCTAGTQGMWHTQVSMKLWQILFFLQTQNMLSEQPELVMMAGTRGLYKSLSQAFKQQCQMTGRKKGKKASDFYLPQLPNLVILF